MFGHCLKHTISGILQFPLASTLCNKSSQKCVRQLELWVARQIIAWELQWLPKCLLGKSLFKREQGIAALRTSNKEQHRAVSSVLCDSKPSMYSQQIIQSTKSRTLSIHGPTTGAPAQSSSLAMPSGNVMFNNLHSWTINVSQAPPPTQPPPMPNIELTKKELDELFSHIAV